MSATRVVSSQASLVFRFGTKEDHLQRGCCHRDWSNGSHRIGEVGSFTVERVGVTIPSWCLEGPHRLVFPGADMSLRAGLPAVIIDACGGGPSRWLVFHALLVGCWPSKGAFLCGHRGVNGVVWREECA